MTKEEIKHVFRTKPGYLKSGTGYLSDTFKVSRNTIISARSEIRAELKELNKPKNIKRLFFDIETSPNIMVSWRAGYKLNLGPENILQERAIICICWKWEDNDEVNYLTWDNNHDDKEMLQIFVEELQKADEAIGHNGDRYDIPWIRTRCLFHRIPMMPDIKSLDTLKKVKSRFYLNSNKLDYIGQFLGVGKKADTGGFDLWKKVCFENCSESLIKMVDYCKQDVVLLEKVYHEIDNYIKHNTHVGVHLNSNICTCPGCGSVNYRTIKEIIAPSGTKSHQLQCTDCNKYYKLNNTNFKKIEQCQLIQK